MAAAAHNRNEEVEAWGQGTAVLSKALHDVGCRGTAGAAREVRYQTSSGDLQPLVDDAQADVWQSQEGSGQRAGRCTARALVARSLTRLLRHDADDGVGGGGARRKG